MVERTSSTVQKPASAAATERLAEYFAVIGIDSNLEALNDYKNCT